MSPDELIDLIRAECPDAAFERATDPTLRISRPHAPDLDLFYTDLSRGASLWVGPYQFDPLAADRVGPVLLAVLREEHLLAASIRNGRAWLEIPGGEVSDSASPDPADLAVLARSSAPRADVRLAGGVLTVEQPGLPAVRVPFEDERLTAYVGEYVFDLGVRARVWPLLAAVLAGRYQVKRGGKRLVVAGGYRGRRVD